MFQVIHLLLLDCFYHSYFSGWTIFDRLYMRNGVVYVVTDEPDRAPNATQMYSKGLFIKPGKETEEERLPTDEDMRIISTKDAKALFGDEAAIVDGVTWLCNDPPQLSVSFNIVISTTV